MALKENDMKWLRPLWLRLAITAFLALWCAWEWLLNGDSFWGLLVGVTFVYFLYNYIIAWPKHQADTLAAPTADSEDVVPASEEADTNLPENRREHRD